jgi:hypothetical protein
MPRLRFLFLLAAALALTGCVGFVGLHGHGGGFYAHPHIR